MKLGIGLAFLTHSKGTTLKRAPKVDATLQVTVLQTLQLKQNHISIVMTRNVILALTIQDLIR
jgi:hypothetical protein